VAADPLLSYRPGRGGRQQQHVGEIALYQMLHRLAGFMAEPAGQLKASVNWGSWESGPFTRKRAGECGLELTCRLRASGVST
jgi:hypothetical protein